MFKFHFKMDENISEACRKSKRDFNRGFRQGAMRAYAQGTLNKLKKVTPKSDKTTKHAADDWEIEYEISGMYIKGFDIVNPNDYLDYVEEGTPPHMIYPTPAKKALRFETNGEVVFSAYVNHPGIKEMGFVRKVQDEMIQGMPSFIRDSFEKEINRFWD